MPGWEETKRIAQNAFVMTGNGYQDMYSSIGNAYQQILLTGHLYPSQGMNDINHQIAEDAYIQPEPQQADTLFYLNHFHTPEPQNPEGDLEPER